MTTISIAHSLAGPIGGVVGIAFGSGSVAGYGFAIRTVLKSAKAQLAEMKTEHASDRADWRAERDREREIQNSERARERENFRTEMASERADCDRRIARLESKIQVLEATARIGPPAAVGDIRQAAQREASTRSVVRRMISPAAEPDPDPEAEALIRKLDEES